MNCIRHSKSWPSFTRRMLSSSSTRRRLDVAIVGLPNAGKSQLINVLTNSTVSAVSRKRHTTRHGVLGARTLENVQLLFLDTPGFLRAQDAKREGLVDRQHLAESSTLLPAIDHTLLVVDAARNLTEPVKRTLIELILLALQAGGRNELGDMDDTDSDDEDSDDEKFHDSSESATTRSFQTKLSIVLNKVDLVHPKSNLMDLATAIGDLTEACLERLYDGPANTLHEQMPMFFYVSAIKMDGTDSLLQYLHDLATPCIAWEVEPGASTDLTPEERVKEIVREKIYRSLHKEVPYRIQQRNTLFRVVKDPSSNNTTSNLGIVVHQELLVQSKSHMELVRGSGGQTLERIRSSAERDLQRIFGCKVVLQLRIKLNRSLSKQWSV